MSLTSSKSHQLFRNKVSSTAPTTPTSELKHPRGHEHASTAKTHRTRGRGVLKKTQSDEVKMRIEMPRNNNNSMVRSQSTNGVQQEISSRTAQTDSTTNSQISSPEMGIKSHRSRAHAFLIPWMKLNNKSKAAQRSSIRNGTKAYARHTDGNWYEVRVAMVTEGHRRILHYGVIYSFSTHIFQVTRDRIMTIAEYEKEKMVKELGASVKGDEQPENNNNISDEEEAIFWSSWDDTGYFDRGDHLIEETTPPTTRLQPLNTFQSDSFISQNLSNKEDEKFHVENIHEEPLLHEAPPKEEEKFYSIHKSNSQSPRKEASDASSTTNTPKFTRRQIVFPKSWLNPKPKSLNHIGKIHGIQAKSLNNSLDIKLNNSLDINHINPTAFSARNYSPPTEDLMEIPMTENYTARDPSSLDTSQSTQKILEKIQCQIELIREKQLINQQKQYELSLHQQKLMKEQLLLFQQQLELQQKFQSLMSQIPSNPSQFQAAMSRFSTNNSKFPQ